MTKSHYRHKTVKKNIYQRSNTYFFVRIFIGMKDGKKQYFQKKLPCKTAQLAIKFGTELIKIVRERKEKAAVAAFMVENNLKF